MRGERTFPVGRRMSLHIHVVGWSSLHGISYSRGCRDASMGTSCARTEAGTQMCFLGAAVCGFGRVTVRLDPSVRQLQRQQAREKDGDVNGATTPLMTGTAVPPDEPPRRAGEQFGVLRRGSGMHVRTPDRVLRAWLPFFSPVFHR